MSCRWTSTPGVSCGSTRLSSRSTSLPGHGDVAGIDQQDVAGRELAGERGVLGREQPELELDRQPREVGARLRVDAGDRAGEAAVEHGLGDEPGRVARADLEHAPRPAGVDDGVEGGTVQAREPVLLPARPRRRPVERAQPVAQGLDPAEPAQHVGHGRGEQRLERGIGARPDGRRRGGRG